MTNCELLMKLNKRTRTKLVESKKQELINLKISKGQNKEDS